VSDTPKRIRDRASYREGQPDLDVYNKCFAGFVSPRFCGSDVDGFFALAESVHGVWERHGHFLFLEHKVHTGAWSRGQWAALNALAELGKRVRRRLVVLVTYGRDPDHPHSYQRLPLNGWRERVNAEEHPVRVISWDEIETVPMRRWIRWVSERKPER
jgi:hypothetical protein